MKETNSTTIQSVEKAINIIEYLANNPSSKLQDVSKQLNIKKSTLHFLIATLKANNYITKSSNSPHYSIGIKLLYLGKKYEQYFDIKDSVHKILVRLRDFTNETAYFTINLGNKYMFIDKEESIKRVKSSIAIGHEEEVSIKTAVGKILIAHTEENKILDIALNIEETEIGMACIGFPLIKDNVILGIISVEGVASNFTQDKIEKIYHEWKYNILKNFSCDF